MACFDEPLSPAQTTDLDSSTCSSILDETVAPSILDETEAPSILDETVPPDFMFPGLPLPAETSGSTLPLNQSPSEFRSPLTKKPAPSSRLSNYIGSSSLLDDKAAPSAEFAGEEPEDREESPESIVFAQSKELDDQENIQLDSIPEGDENLDELDETFLSSGTSKSSKSIEIIDITTSKKASPSRSPLLPTQPPSESHSARKRQSTLRNGTLDNWLQWRPPPAKPKPNPVNAAKYAYWANLSPDITREKPNRGCSKTSLVSVKNFSERLSSTAKNSSIPLIHVAEEPEDPVRNVSKCQKKNSSSSLQVSHHESVQSKSHNRAGRTSKSLDSTVVLSPNSTELTLPPESSYEACQSDTVPSVSQDSSVLPISQDSSVLPLSQNSDSPVVPVTQDSSVLLKSQDSFVQPLSTYSTLSGLRNPKKLKQITLESALSRSNVVAYHKVSESQHARTLRKAILSPSFCRNDNKYVVNELSSRFDDDGKVRRKKSDRKLLHGFECKCCAGYYEALGLNEDERRERVDQVSKHRDVAPEPSTPEHYWDVGMPNREEQRRRGQIVESVSPIAIKTRNPQYESKKPARRRLFS